MSGFIEWLEKCNQADTRVRAELRHSLAFEPGAYPRVYPFVEPFLTEDDRVWRRHVHYLVAALWAMHWREGSRGRPVSLATACARHRHSSGSESTERRFINLLDSDSGQLTNRLRQIIGLLADQPIDFDLLLRGLLFWNDRKKRTQQSWAREFYRFSSSTGEQENRGANAEEDKG